MLRNKKKPINKEMQINIITPEAWTAYFQNLYQDSSKNIEPKTNEDSNKTMMENEYYAITLRDMKKIMTQRTERHRA